MKSGEKVFLCNGSFNEKHVYSILALTKVVMMHFATSLVKGPKPAARLGGNGKKVLRLDCNWYDRFSLFELVYSITL